jgi:threonine dehydrogenase-like Zn-dependent dehydrogenase
MPETNALWYVSDGRAELRAVDVPALQKDGVRVRARYSGLSRGTERLVLHGRVPVAEQTRMRCPHQMGDFPFPVKYGYAMVGVIEDGPPDRVGQTGFLLHPHQQTVCVAASDAHPVPADVPARRAALTANMETALNVTWDAGAAPGDRILVVGGGVLGLLIAGIIGQIPGTAVTVADVDATRAPVAAGMGAAFALPHAAPSDQDIVIHTSSTAEGLRLALAAAGTEARVVEASWYGDKEIAAPLGGSFHSRRLQLISSQVGMVPAHRRVRWTYARRIAAALDLLRDPRFDALITGEVAFADAPARVPHVLDSSSGLMTVLRY